ncbi:MAG: hypothetical protein KBC53_07815 [Nitrosomonas sp.]|nr:hypothetical protein [Nitrosomonas sp.]
MADEVDITNDFYQRIEERNVAAIRSEAAKIPAGVAGICEHCEEDSGRLVFGHCARCREIYNLR